MEVMGCISVLDVPSLPLLAQPEFKVFNHPSLWHATTKRPNHLNQPSSSKSRTLGSFQNFKHQKNIHIVIWSLAILSSKTKNSSKENSSSNTSKTQGLPSLPSTAFFRFPHAAPLRDSAAAAWPPPRHVEGGHWGAAPPAKLRSRARRAQRRLFWSSINDLGQLGQLTISVHHSTCLTYTH